jgi:hypothetical protein
MREAYPGGCAGVAIRFESRHAIALGTPEWLGLAAAPTFAIMALLTGILWQPAGYALFGGARRVIAERNDPDYLLMNAFHSASLRRSCRSL